MTHTKLTLNGAAQQLASVLTAATSTYDRPLKLLTIQANPANSNPVYLGGPGVSATSYAIIIPTPASGVAAAPLFIDESSALDLRHIYAIGTNAEILRIGLFY